jgi:hypothetical protein
MFDNMLCIQMRIYLSGDAKVLKHCSIIYLLNNNNIVIRPIQHPAVTKLTLQAYATSKFYRFVSRDMDCKTMTERYKQQQCWLLSSYSLNPGDHRSLKRDSQNYNPRKIWLLRFIIGDISRALRSNSLGYYHTNDGTIIRVDPIRSAEAWSVIDWELNYSILPCTKSFFSRRVFYE